MLAQQRQSGSSGEAGLSLVAAGPAVAPGMAPGVAPGVAQGVVPGAAPGVGRSLLGRLLLRRLRYPNAYAWFILLSTLDILLTGVLLHLGGREVNVVALTVLEHYHLVGLVVFKFATVLLSIGMCELIALRRPHLGRKIAVWAAVITAVPVALSLLMLMPG